MKDSIQEILNSFVQTEMMRDVSTAATLESPQTPLKNHSFVSC